jgi:hypothetical protein
MQLLCALCSSGRIDPLPLATTLSAQDWDRFWQLTLRHRVGPTVTRALSQQPAIQIPEHIQAKMHRETQQNALKALRTAAELVRLTHLLETAQIRFVTFKGIALTQQMGLAIQERHVGDIDLLLANKDDIWRADALILQAGYQRDTPAAAVLNSKKQRHYYLQQIKDITYIHPQQGHRLELHHRLLPNPATCDLSAPSVYAARSYIRLGQTNVPCINTADHQLYLLLHGAISHWFRLKWLCDIPAISQQGNAYFDPAFLKQAESLGVERMVTQGLSLAHQLLGMPIATPIITQYRAQKTIQRITRQARAALLRTQPWHESLHRFSDKLAWYVGFRTYHLWTLRKDLTYKLYWLQAYATEQSDWTLLPLPDALFFLYYPLRPVLWLLNQRR